MVTVQEVSCQDIPVEYVDELPAETSGSVMRIIDGGMVNGVPKDGGLVSKLAKRARPIPARPLTVIDLDTIDPIALKKEAGKMYENIRTREHYGNPWFEQDWGVTAKWMEFPKYPYDKTAVGVRDLTGCTVAMIITSKGVFVVHIWESFFVDEESQIIDVDEFDRLVIESLVGGGNRGAGSLLDLIGTDQAPGQLHHTKEPTIVVITPHNYDEHGKVFRYQSHAQRLADRLGRAIYPNGHPEQKDPLVAAYDPKAQLTDVEKGQIPRAYRKVFRKIALEVTRRNVLMHEETRPGERPKVFFRGAWRLWAGPDIVLEQDFWDEDSWFDKFPPGHYTGGRNRRDESEGQEEEGVDPCLYWDGPLASSSGNPTAASSSRALINTSTTPFGTSATPTPTPTGLCSYEACSNDSECALEDGATGFVSTGHVDCSDVPLEEVDHLPDQIEGSEIVMLGGDSVKANHLTKRVIRERPLRDLENLREDEKPEAYRREVLRTMVRLTANNGWVGKNPSITAKWIPLPQFPNDRMAVGLRDLNGCNVVVIITRDGVYVAHFWEAHYFAESGTDHAISAPDFMERTIAPLAGESEQPEPHIQDTIRTLIGTDDEPGALHPTHEPQIFVITPWEVGQVGRAYAYPEHARLLADSLGELIYPDGYPKEELRPIIKAYDREVRGPGVLGNPYQKVILEMTRRNEAARMTIDGHRRVHFRGAWRLWVGVERIGDIKFWKPDNWIPTFYNGDDYPIVKRADEVAEENAVDACPYWTMSSGSPTGSSSMMSPTTAANQNLPRTLLTTTKGSKVATKSSETKPAGLSG